MMLKRTAIIVVVIGSLLAGMEYPARAQAGQGGTQATFGEARTKHMSEKLNMTADQESELRPIMQEHEKQVKAVDEQGALSPLENKEQKKTIREQTDKKIMKILTPEQRKKFEVSKKMRAKMGIE